MTKEDVLELLSWLENVFPDQIKFGSEHITSLDAKLALAEGFLSSERQRRLVK